MAVYTYEDIIPTLVPSTIMQKIFGDGIHVRYTIKAIDGYVLHDTNRDYEEPDETGEILTPKRGYTTARATCPASYDFTPSQITIDDGTVVTAYGPREYFAIPANAVPGDQIFGGGTINPPVTE